VDWIALRNCSQTIGNGSESSSFLTTLLLSKWMSDSRRYVRAGFSFVCRTCRLWAASQLTAEQNAPCNGRETWRHLSSLRYRLGRGQTRYCLCQCQPKDSRRRFGMRQDRRWAWRELTCRCGDDYNLSEPPRRRLDGADLGDVVSTGALGLRRRFGMRQDCRWAWKELTCRCGDDYNLSEPPRRILDEADLETLSQLVHSDRGQSNQL
jgi:hypothetical protein